MIEPLPIDQNLLLALNFDGGPLLDQVMYIVSGKFTWIPLYILLLWLVYRRSGWRGAALFLGLAAMMVLCADQSCTFAKNHFSKFRPTHYPPLEGLVHTVNGYVGGLYGTVSSHAANSVGLAVLASMVIRRRWVTVTLAVWSVAVCYSRIYLGVHYPMDILLGTLTGVLWGWVWYRVGEWVRSRYAAFFAPVAH